MSFLFAEADRRAHLGASDPSHINWVDELAAGTIRLDLFMYDLAGGTFTTTEEQMAVLTTMVQVEALTGFGVHDGAGGGVPGGLAYATKTMSGTIAPQLATAPSRVRIVPSVSSYAWLNLDIHTLDWSTRYLIAWYDDGVNPGVPWFATDSGDFTPKKSNGDNFTVSIPILYERAHVGVNV